MSESSSDPYFLTPLDSIPGYSGLRYAHQVIFFPRPESDPSSIVRHVKVSLTKTIEAIPLLAGTVRHVNHPSQRGRMAITAPWRTADDIITVKDLTKTGYASYETLRSNHFPLSAVDYSVLMTLPPRDQDDGPAIIIQINFIEGGMIWGIVYDHAYTDGAGAAFVPKVWAAYCRGEDGSKLVTPDIVQRERLMHGSNTGTLENYPLFYYDPEVEVPKAEAPERDALATSRFSRMLESLRSGVLYRLRSVSAIISQSFDRRGAGLYNQAILGEAEPQVNEVAGEVFFFPREKLNELKKRASTQTDWISTNDALASLLYCCITDINKTKTRPNNDGQIDDPTKAAFRAQWIDKMAVLGSHETNEPFAVLGFATNARKHFNPPLPPDYVGNVTVWNGFAAPFSTVASSLQTVSDFAYRLRRRMQLVNTSYMHDFVGVLDLVPNISRIGLNPGPFAEHLVVVNSWAGFKWHDVDWGSVVGGKCERLRIETVKVPGFCLVLPEIGAGSRCEGGAGLEVVVALKQDDLESLKKNELFMSFAEWRCH